MRSTGSFPVVALVSRLCLLDLVYILFVTGVSFLFLFAFSAYSFFSDNSR
jgi:hypothetical protein